MIHLKDWNKNGYIKLRNICEINDIYLIQLICNIFLYMYTLYFSVCVYTENFKQILLVSSK
jgi:hypothetical protein